MFGIGLPELILILGIALIVVGPEKLPELAKSLGKGINELKKTATALKESMTEELKEEAADPWRQNLDATTPAGAPGVNPPLPLPEPGAPVASDAVAPPLPPADQILAADQVQTADQSAADAGGQLVSDPAASSPPKP